MKLQREQLEKMFSERIADRASSVGYTNGYNQARNEIIDKLCEMEIKIDIDKAKDCLENMDEEVDFRYIKQGNDIILDSTVEFAFAQCCVKALDKSDCLTLEVEDETK